jgi:hypothetical protein
MLDMPLSVDQQPVLQAIERAEVVSIFFPWIGLALVVDFRHNDVARPAVLTDEIAGSLAERLTRIARRRPDLPPPTRLAAIPWPSGVRSFLDSGAYDRLVYRLYQLGHGDVESDCRRARAALQRAEYVLKLAYIRGEHCRTLYQAP